MFDNLQNLPKAPEVTFTKNGYQIRTEILEMAKDLVQAEFQAKWQGWELTAKRDEKTGQIVTEVEMPKFPGIEQVLTAAEMLYKFVNITNSSGTKDKR